MPPWAGSKRFSENDPQGRKAKTPVTMLLGLAPMEDTDTMLVFFGKVTV